MLPYYQQFCNAFPALATPRGQGPGVNERCRRGHPRWVAVVWRVLSFAGLARLWQSQQAARLSTPHLHVARMYSPIQRSATRMWRTLQSASLLDDHTCTRRHPPHALALGAVYLHTPEGSAVIVLESRGVMHSFWCTYWRRPFVPTGDAPRTYWRRTMI